jgi:hypothetical protein
VANNQLTCPVDGKRFTAWRGKQFCSGRCANVARKRRERGQGIANTRPPKRVLSRGAGSLVPDDIKTAENDIEIIGKKHPLSRDGQPLIWEAVNNVTDKLVQTGSPLALGWAMRIDGMGWLGRARDKHGEFSFGPASLPQVRKAVEAWVKRDLTT